MGDDFFLKISFVFFCTKNKRKQKKKKSFIDRYLDAPCDWMVANGRGRQLLGGISRFLPPIILSSLWQVVGSPESKTTKIGLGCGTPKMHLGVDTVNGRPGECLTTSGRPGPTRRPDATPRPLFPSDTPNLEVCLYIENFLLGQNFYFYQSCCV